jgi:DNA-binding response OmpR family regulator
MHILVVEDEILVGMDLVQLLTDWGHEATGPLKDIDAVLRRIEESRFDFAFLDVNLGSGKTSFPIADRLSEQGVPFAFLTGYDPVRFDDPSNKRNARSLRKPLNEMELRRALDGAAG